MPTSKTFKSVSAATFGLVVFFLATPSFAGKAPTATTNPYEKQLQRVLQEEKFATDTLEFYKEHSGNATLESGVAKVVFSTGLAVLTLGYAASITETVFYTSSLVEATTFVTPAGIGFVIGALMTRSAALQHLGAAIVIASAVGQVGLSAKLGYDGFIDLVDGVGEVKARLNISEIKTSLQAIDQALSTVQREREKVDLDYSQWTDFLGIRDSNAMKKLYQYSQSRVDLLKMKRSILELLIKTQSS